MKNKTLGIAAVTGLCSAALSTLLSPPSALIAQQTKSDYAAPSATAPTAQSKPQARPTDCAQGGPSGASFNGRREGAGFREASFDGPHGVGFDGPPGGGRGPGGPEGREGRRPGPPPGPGGEGGRMRGPQLDEMLERLNLTDAQKEKIDKVRDFEREKMDALHEQIEKLQTQTRTNVEAILTTEQKQQLEKMETRAANDDRSFGGPRGPRPGGRPGGPRGGERGGGW